MTKYLIILFLLPCSLLAQGGTSAFGTGNINDPDGRGVSLNFAAGTKIATPFYCTYDGTLDSISIGLSDSGDPDSVYFFIYSDNTGEPNSLLATSSDSAYVSGTDDAEAIYTLSLSTSLSASTTYWIGFGNSAGSDINYSYIRSTTSHSRSHADLRPYDASWNTGGDAAVNAELLAIAYYTTDDSIRHLYPSGDGTYDDWCALSDCYPYVDEPARHDSSGTAKTASGDDSQSYTLPNWTDVGGDAGDTIDSVQIIGVVKRNNTNAGNLQIPFIYDGADSIHGATYLDAALPQEYVDTTIADVFTTAPDGGAWTVTDVDNLQIGITSENGLFGGTGMTQLHAIVYYHVEVASSPPGILMIRRR